MQRQIMKKMQKMQEKLQSSMGQMQNELEKAEVEGSAGGGMVKVRVNGHQQVLSVKIAKEAVDPEDVETLEDLVFAAVKDAMDKAREISAQKMSQLTAGLPLPPGMF
ncbi:MAG: YbaB/EbfC family nucleoid-associated protein [Candidatus Eremiobacterota bacterium]